MFFHYHHNIHFESTPSSQLPTDVDEQLTDAILPCTSSKAGRRVSFLKRCTSQCLQQTHYTLIGFTDCGEDLLRFKLHGWRATCKINDLHCMKAFHQSANPICSVSMCKYLWCVAFEPFWEAVCHLERCGVKVSVDILLLPVHVLTLVSTKYCPQNLESWWSVRQQVVVSKVAQFKKGAVQGTKCQCHWWKETCCFLYRCTTSSENNLKLLGIKKSQPCV